MKKFLVKVDLDYVQRHLRYGHREYLIEAETQEEAYLMQTYAEAIQMELF